MTPGHDPSSPLTSEQLSTARDVGARMHHALTLLLGTLPAAQRTAKGAADHLGIEGVVAKRIVRAANSPAGEPRLLTRLPSIENLRKVANAASANGVDQGTTDGLRAAIDAFERFSSSVGGGKTGLTRRLRATLVGSETIGD